LAEAIFRFVFNLKGQKAQQKDCHTINPFILTETLSHKTSVLIETAT